MEKDDFFDLENPLTALPEHQSETIPSLFSSEADHMPCQNYVSTFKSTNLDVSIRRQAISSILQMQFFCKFDPFILYLSINYLDRFISKQKIPEGKPWILKLISLTCISLAAKMKRIKLSITDFDREGLVFDAESVHRMELLILGSLNWRMRSITPFSFINFFLSLFNLKDPPLLQALKARATEIIFKSQTEIKTLQFKPSMIAASALLSASHELLPLQFPSFQSAILSCVYVNKEKLLECCDAIQQIVIEGYESVFDKASSSQTPDNVLDLHYCSSSESDEKGNNVTTSQATLKADRDTKRRKISTFNTLKRS